MPSITRGSSATFTAAGLYTRGNGGWDGGASYTTPIPDSTTWCVDNNSYVPVAAFDPSIGDNGWNVARSGNQITVTVPANADLGEDYAAYHRIAGDDYYYVLFDVTDAPVVSGTTPIPGYSATVAADNPLWWFPLDEAESDAAATGYASRTNSARKLTRVRTVTQVTSLLPAYPTGFSAQLDSGLTSGGVTNGSGSGGGLSGGGLAQSGSLRNAAGGTYGDWEPLATDSITFEAWVQVGATGQAGYIAQLSSIDPRIAQSGTSLVSAIYLDTASGNTMVTRTSANVFTSASTVYHIVVTFDASTRIRKHYVNGVLADSFAEDGAASLHGSFSAPTTPVTSTQILAVGEDGTGAAGAGGNRWYGTLAHLALYRSALPASRVLAHYNAGIGTPISLSARRRCSSAIF